MAARATLKRFLVRTSVATAVFASGTLYAYRPRPSWETEYFKSLRGREPQMSAPERFLWNVGQACAVAPTMAALKGLLFGLNTTEMIDFDKFEEQFYKRGDRALITVANHTSILDDPGVISAILPWSVVWKPSTMRWSICSEELCFFNPFVGAFMGAGRVLPIKRGGSIYQKVLVDYQKAVERGEWMHIFPEGRVWQEGGTPFRDKQGRWCSESGRCGDPYSKLGPMKWGIAKVIANAEVPPAVLPFYHLGMEEVMPQQHSNDIIHSMPAMGKHITVQFGDTVEFEDLIEEYHKAAKFRASQRAKVRSAAQQLGRKGEGKAVEEEAKGAFPHIDPTAPVLEVCSPPSRFRLRIIPPDHQLLNEEELAREEVIRLQLYSDIASRISESLRLLEDRVRDVRRQQGHENLDDKQW